MLVNFLNGPEPFGRQPLLVYNSVLGTEERHYTAHHHQYNPLRK
jgi:hypothetical protein